MQIGLGTDILPLVAAGTFALVALRWAEQPVHKAHGQPRELHWLVATAKAVTHSRWPFVVGVTVLILGGLFLLVYREPLSLFIRDITRIEFPGGGKIERTPSGDSGRSQKSRDQKSETTKSRTQVGDLVGVNP